jgi:hypothetical protein
VLTGCLEYIGRDTLLGSFLAVASGGAPLCHWSSLAKVGCGRDGPKGAPWFTTGPPCQTNPIPATGVGGPFLELAAPLYFDERRIPWGPLSLGQSAGNMLRAQARFARQRGLDLAGWSSASDPNLCHYMTCPEFVPAKVSPYVWAMGASFVPTLAEPALRAFHDAGAGAPLATGTRSRALGLRDAWNQATDSGRDAYLYLDTGWTALGLLNACHADLVRRSFGEHELAKRAYRRLRHAGPLCPQ